MSGIERAKSPRLGKQSSQVSSSLLGPSIRPTVRPTVRPIQAKAIRQLQAQQQHTAHHIDGWPLTEPTNQRLFDAPPLSVSALVFNARGTPMAAVVYANRGLVHSPSYALSPSCEAPLSFAKNRLFSLLPVFYSFSLSVCRFVHPAPELLLFVRAEQSRAESSCAVGSSVRPSVRLFFSCCLRDSSARQRMDRRSMV